MRTHSSDHVGLRWCSAARATSFLPRLRPLAQSLGAPPPSRRAKRVDALDVRHRTARLYQPAAGPVEPTSRAAGPYLRPAECAWLPDRCAIPHAHPALGSAPARARVGHRAAPLPRHAVAARAAKSANLLGVLAQKLVYRPLGHRHWPGQPVPPARSDVLCQRRAGQPTRRILSPRCPDCRSRSCAPYLATALPTAPLGAPMSVTQRRTAPARPAGQCGLVPSLHPPPAPAMESVALSRPALPGPAPAPSASVQTVRPRPQLGLHWLWLRRRRSHLPTAPAPPAMRS